MSSEKLKKRFGEHLTCDICLELYTEPKMLPCHHSYCLKCLLKLPKDIFEEGHYSFKCPTCRTPHSVPEAGLSTLPSDFRLNGLLELHNAILTESPNREEYCENHKDLLRVYCETCHKVICRDCTITDAHKRHTWHLISDCYHKHRQEIVDCCKHLITKLAGVNTALERLSSTKQEITKQGEFVKEQIVTHAQQIIEKVKQSQLVLTQRVDDIIKEKVHNISEQQREAELIQRKLKACQERMERNLCEWSRQKILTEKCTILKDMHTATHNVDPEVFTPLETSDIAFTNASTMISSDGSIGQVTSTVYGRGTLKILVPGGKEPLVATLTLQSSNGSPLSLPLSLISSTFSSVTGDSTGEGTMKTIDSKCSVNQSSEGIYNIRFSQPASRNDLLHVKVGGVDIHNSPLSLPYKVPPHTRGKALRTIPSLKKPWGIAVHSNGQFITTQNGSNDVLIFNRSGTIIQTLDCHFSAPLAVALSQDESHIFVTDEHRLVKVSLSTRRIISSVGTSISGSSHMQFNYPKGIGVHPETGDVYVADSVNNRIQVFNDDLKYLNTIANVGNKEFLSPSDVAFDADGNIYITELLGHCITKFTTKGRFLGRFGTKGFGTGMIESPSSLAVRDGLIYVTDYGNNRVSIFGVNKKFIHSFGDKMDDVQLDRPRGITMDISGNLYISDFLHNRIVLC